MRSPQLILVNLHDLALQFEALLGEEFEIADVVCRVLICVIVSELSWKEEYKAFSKTTAVLKPAFTVYSFMYELK